MVSDRVEVRPLKVSAIVSMAPLYRASMPAWMMSTASCPLISPLEIIS